MCTAATYLTKDFYFGRNLDYEFPYGESVTITPRGYSFDLRRGEKFKNRYAIIGMAHVQDGYPLYYDAVNEKGLCIAGLNFVGNAKYHTPVNGKDNITQFELIPWLLGSCAGIDEARTLLERLNITDVPFSDGMPLAQLHWLIADQTGSITVESTADGLHVYDNPVGVLTNNPPFPMQLFNLNNYMALSPESPVNTFAPDAPLATYSRGMGAIGLPGDLSSQSRFVRAAFVRAHALCQPTEASRVNQFFHILTSVEQQRGCCALGEGKYEITLYSSCCNATRGVYYYTTYENRQITAVDMHKENLDGGVLIRYPLLQGPAFRAQN